MAISVTRPVLGAPPGRAVPTRLLYEAQVELDAPLDFGMTPHGVRNVVAIRGGAFAGPSIRGEVLPGGADWVLVRPDGVAELDIRTAGRTDDGALLHVQERGYLRAPPQVLGAFARGEPVDPAAYSLRLVATFETSAPRYAWLNATIAVAVGTLRQGGLDLAVHEVL